MPTHTYAMLPVPEAVYRVIRAKLEEHGYEHAIDDDGELDMHGIAIVSEEVEDEGDGD